MTLTPEERARREREKQILRKLRMTNGGKAFITKRAPLPDEYAEFQSAADEADRQARIEERHKAELVSLELDTASKIPQLSARLEAIRQQLNAYKAKRK